MTEIGFRLQEAVENAIAALAEVKLDRAIGIVAEYPAHLPPVDGDELAISQTLARVIQIVMLNTSQDEVRIRVQTIPPSSDLPDGLQARRIQCANPPGVDLGL